MSESIHRSVRCSQCGELLDERPDEAVSLPCLNCGGMARTVHLAIEEREDVALLDSLRGKVQDQSRRFVR